MKTWKAKVWAETDLLLGEGARWDENRQEFLFIDIKDHLVGTIALGNTIPRLRRLSKMPGMVAPASNGNLIVALQGEIAELQFETGVLRTLVEIERSKPANRCNDGACDAMGRLWIGTMHSEAQLNEGNLYCFGQKLEKKIAGTSVSNGICWSADQQTMYHIDSYAYTICAYDFDLATGNICNKRTVVAINKEEGYCADGMCIDTEGMLWVAIWNGSCVNRYNPANGQLIGKVEVDAPLVTSCAFGGKNMDRLLITTAKDGLTEAELAKYPNSGALFLAEVEARGLVAHQYKITK